MLEAIFWSLDSEDPRLYGEPGQSTKGKNVIKDFRINRVLYYSGEGMIAWTPTAIATEIIRAGVIAQGSSAMVYAYMLTIGFAVWIIWRFVPKPYKFVTAFGGYLLVGMVIELSKLV